MVKTGIIKKIRHPIRRIRKQLAQKASAPMRRIRTKLSSRAAVPMERIRNIRKRLRRKTNISLPPFIESIEERDKVRIIHLRGDIVRENIPEIERFRNDLVSAKGSKSKNMILDFKKVTDVDSATLATVILQVQEMKKKHHRVGLANINAEMRGMIEIFKVKDQFLVFNSVEKAVKDLG
jgi:anti-anti-sigma factor